MLAVGRRPLVVSTVRLGYVAPVLGPHQLAPIVLHRRCLAAARANKEDKSWGEIAQEAADVVKSVVNKVKDGATTALESITKKPAAPVRQQRPAGSSSPFGRDDGGRPLPMPLPGGGLLGGLMGGLVNTAIKGIADQLEKSAAESRSVAELAAERIQGSRRVKQRLGEVTVGLPLSQSVSSQNINGRVSKSVSLVLPVYNAAGALVAQANVTQVEGQMEGGSCRIAVRMPTGDTLVLDDGGDDYGSGSGGGSSSRQHSKVGSSPAGEVIDAEFKDL